MIRLKIDGMSCNHCVGAVAKALEAIPGVQHVVEVSLERGEAVIEGAPDAGLLVAAVKEEGFEAELAV